MKRSEIAGNVLGSLVWLAILNLYPFWLPFTLGAVTVEWSRIVWTASIAAVVTIAANLLLFVVRTRSLQHVVGLVTSAASLVSTAVVFEVFPFAFHRLGLAWIDLVLWIVLLVAIIATVIGIGVRLVRAAFSSDE
jgi:hypothetical protein